MSLISNHASRGLSANKYRKELLSGGHHGLLVRHPSLLQVLYVFNFKEIPAALKILSTASIRIMAIAVNINIKPPLSLK